MQTRTIAGREVLGIGLGAMAVDEYEPKAKEEDAIELFKFAVDSGVNLIDTADVYGLGRNETLIGKALSIEQKEKIIIATKAGCTRPGGYGWDTDGRPEHIKKAIEGSLERLGIKQIELYMLHAPDHRVPFKESLQAFKELQEQGLVKNIGVSNFSLEQLKEAQKLIKVVSVENHFSLSFKGDEQELLPYLTENKIAFLPYFPLSSGKLLQNEKLNDISKELNLTPSQVALSWITTKWETAIPIPGTQNKEHLLENIKAADIKLEKETIEKLDGLY
ncbi:MAG: aldo/keto reductase [Nanoarchaeota archaeon]|nr:aldo/keto reductase [Nanoarchaeota archaeon]